MRLAQAALDSIRAHAQEGYPDEVCGLLIGEAGRGLASDARRVRNTITERARDRYEIDPLDQLRIQRECDRSGMEVIGYYHSHPDHPAHPSKFDSDRAWAGPVYVIVSVAEGKMVAANAFVASSDGGPFGPEPLEIE